MKKGTLFQLLIIFVLIGALGFSAYKTKELIDDNYKVSEAQNNNEPFSKNNNQMGNSNSVESKGNKEVTTKETLNDEYLSSKEDVSSIKVSDGGELTLDGAKVTKTGDSTNTENSEFYGVNAGILTENNSTSTIKNSTITTDAVGANAVFATGENAKVYISDSTIKTTGKSSSRGLDSTYGGYIEADNVTISTEGGSSATLATDRGEGTVIAKNSKLTTNGAGSPIIYSTGNITVEKSEGVANGAQITVVEGKNTATIKESTIKCSGKGNRNEVDNCGIMIYQSMSGDAGEGTGVFNSEDSTLEILSDSTYYKTAPMFFITNTNAVINLSNTKLKFGSNILLNASSTSEWGKTGSNGGIVTLNAKSQELKGDIKADSISEVTLNLESSIYEGTINGENSAKSVSLKLDSSSKITLTGDTYITSLEGEDSTYSNISFNGHKLYVNGTEIN